MMMMMTMTDRRAMDPSAGGNGGDDEGLPDIEGLRFTDQQSETLNRTAGSSSVDVESASLVCDVMICYSIRAVMIRCHYVM